MGPAVVGMAQSGFMCTPVSVLLTDMITLLRLDLGNLFHPAAAEDIPVKVAVVVGGNIDDPRLSAAICNASQRKSKV